VWTFQCNDNKKIVFWGFSEESTEAHKHNFDHTLITALKISLPEKPFALLLSFKKRGRRWQIN
jgi:hypothetical protein